MQGVWLVLAAAGWFGLLVLGTVMASRARRASLRAAVTLRKHLRPYLRRRAAEAGIELEESLAISQEAIVTELCDLADRLTAHERGELAHGDTATMAVSDTVQMPLGTGPQQPKP